MKKLIPAFIALFVLFTFSPVALRAAELLPGSTPAPLESVEMQALKNRIHEIRALDKSALSKAEKKELRHELRTIKHSFMAGNNNGIYLSLGAIIVVILLLILLL